MEIGVAVVVIFNGRGSYFFLFFLSFFASDFMRDYPSFCDEFGSFFSYGLKLYHFTPESQVLSLNKTNK